MQETSEALSPGQLISWTQTWPGKDRVHSAGTWGSQFHLGGPFFGSTQGRLSILIMAGMDVLNCFSHVQLFATLWTVACHLLCPWVSPGKNTGVGCHAFLQEIFSTQGWNPRLSPALAGSSLPLVLSGKPLDHPASV